MAKTKTYKITGDDGGERWYKLDEAGYDLFKRLADDKTSAIKAITAGTPTPINAASAGTKA